LNRAALPAFTACTADADCTIVPAACCGSCGIMRANEARAIARARSDAFHDNVCGKNAMCPMCMGTFDTSLDARCMRGRCTLTETPLPKDCRDTGEGGLEGQLKQGH
jgi:hypothetical protein